MSKITESQSPPAWLVDWMRDAGAHAQCHSLVLCASSGPNLHRLACAVSDYLNEFDGLGSCQWRAFDTEELRHLAGDPTCRRLLLAGAPPVPEGVPHDSDLNRTARRLARLGGVILEGQCGFEATLELPEAFHVCLSKGDHPRRDKHHLWLNPERFQPDTLVSIIADSFLNWSSVTRSPGTRTTSVAGASGPSL